MTIKIRTLIIFFASFIVILILSSRDYTKDYKNIYNETYRDVDFEVDYTDMVSDVRNLETKPYPKVRAKVKSDGAGICTLEGKGYVIKILDDECFIFIGEEKVYTFTRFSLVTPVSEGSRMKIPIVVWILILFFAYAVIYTFLHFVLRKHVFRTTLVLN